MNNTVRPIFNEKVVKKWYLWVPEQYTDVLFIVEKSMFAAKKIKKRGWNAHRSKCGRSKRGFKPHLWFHYHELALHLLSVETLPLTLLLKILLRPQKGVFNFLLCFVYHLLNYFSMYYICSRGNIPLYLPQWQED